MIIHVELGQVEPPGRGMGDGHDIHDDVRDSHGARGIHDNHDDVRDNDDDDGDDDDDGTIRKIRDWAQSIFLKAYLHGLGGNEEDGDQQDKK